ncbi:TPA: hypothetical protein DIV49_00445 [Candidatus Saccharibacteria bacterium]|nr:hypothetical protein [Candidatus Saccharibacteria bacterium]HRJ91065.1 hypothetical protein [Candidatus Saccharibacteria bacterium]
MSEYSMTKQEKKAIPAQLEGALIISLKEARKIMGVDARTLSDDELTIEIWRLMEVASDLLKLTPPLTEKQL